MTKKTSTPMSRSAARAHAKKAPQEAETIDDFLSSPEPSSLDELISSTRVSTLIAVTMLQVALSKRDNLRLSESEGLAMTVTVPDSSWMTPVA